MKKIYIILTLILLLVTGCGSNNASTIDLKKASDALDKKYTEMVSFTDSELESIYGLDLSIFEEYVIKSSSKTNGDFYAIIKVDSKNKNDAKSAMDGLFTVLEKQSNLYSPAAVERLNNKLSTSVGDYLIYIASSDNDAYYNEIKEYIS